MEKLARIENRIRRKREELGYRQSDLAFLLDHKSSSQISKYERGLIFPDSERLLKLSYILKTTPDWLYPEVTKKWKKEVAKREEVLREKLTPQIYENI